MYLISIPTTGEFTVVLIMNFSSRDISLVLRMYKVLKTSVKMRRSVFCLKLSYALYKGI
jgi:hypothetical protein